MKQRSLLPALLLASSFGFLVPGHAQLTINYDFAPNTVVTDNGQIAIGQTLGGLSGLSTFGNVVTRLSLTTGTTANPMYLGDMYSTLTFGQTGEAGQRIAVLLNRPGRDANNIDGSALNSLRVTLDDSVTSTATTNVFNATGNGTYFADGRLGSDPKGAATGFTPGSNGLVALNGTTLASNRVSLLVGDYSKGGIATLSAWGVSVTGTAASSGYFTPYVAGATTSISDTNSASVNNIGANLITTGGTVTFNLAGSTTLSGGAVGSGGLTKMGAGTLSLTGAGTFTGPTVVNAGTLALANPGGAAISNMSSVAVNQGGTLLFGAANQIATSVSISLNGGTIQKAGSSDQGTTGAAGLGALTLTAASKIDFTQTNGILNFSSFTDSTGAVLTISNYVGNGSFGGVDQLIFGNDVSGMTSDFDFGFGSGTNVGVASLPNGMFEVYSMVAVPEPATLLGGLLIVGALGWNQRRRIGGWLASGRSRRPGHDAA